MIADHNIICFANDWDGDPLSKKHVMARLARKNRILWVNSLGNRNPRVSSRDLRRIFKKLGEFVQGPKPVAQNIKAFTPLAIPFHGSRAAGRINPTLLKWMLRGTCRRLRFRKPLITWAFTPSSADVVGNLGEDLVIYHCVDDFSEFTGTNKQAILTMERRLIEKSDLVFVSSSPLYEAKSQYHPRTFLVTHGVEVEHFRRACLSQTSVPKEIQNLKGPVVGFFGLIADWVDLDLIRYLAQSRLHWSFVLIGQVETDISTIKGLPNVHLLGRKTYESLPAYCKGFDAAILPFVVNKLTVAANPLKLREYLAAGLPVVSTAIPEAESLGMPVRVSRSRSDFLSQLDAVMESGETGPQPGIAKTMDEESWDRKVEDISEIVQIVRSSKPRVPEAPLPRDRDLQLRTRNS